MSRSVSNLNRGFVSSNKAVKAVLLAILSIVSTSCLFGGTPPGMIQGERHSYSAKDTSMDTSIIAEFDSYVTVDTSKAEVSLQYPNITLVKNGPESYGGAQCYYDITAYQDTSSGQNVYGWEPGETNGQFVPCATSSPGNTSPHSCANMSCSGQWTVEASFSVILPSGFSWTISGGEDPDLCTITGSQIQCRYDSNETTIS